MCAIDALTLVVSSTGGILKIVEVKKEYAGYCLREMKEFNVDGHIHLLNQDSQHKCVLYACELDGTVLFSVCLRIVGALVYYHLLL